MNPIESNGSYWFFSSLYMHWIAMSFCSFHSYSMNNIVSVAHSGRKQLPTEHQKGHKVVDGCPYRNKCVKTTNPYKNQRFLSYAIKDIRIVLNASLDSNFLHVFYALVIFTSSCFSISHTVVALCWDLITNCEFF